MSPFRAILTLLLASPLAARAQFAAYVTFSPTHLSNVATGAVYAATDYNEATASYWSSGIGGGVTVPILHLPIVALNLDLRGSSRPGTAGMDSALLGLQLAIHPHIVRFKPYVEIAGGYLDSRTTNLSTSSANSGAFGGTFTNKYAAYEVLGGVDYPLIHFVDFRIVEIGVGEGTAFSSTNATVVTVNTGLVVHF